ncbi:hypothetical protein [Chitinophaga arvensicola]|uniref:MG2 domain-containing protein n=1 Tax=Chitinophaga arvensicola TaxID=29529 RepID=A0A1I0QCW9_9BACT|nr:hypothetical protein [Chitinophaga arvensicola]SEW24791.1 hypothetical protein SAMN04488122_1380 [Chitinophaga arvensicola]
MVTHSTSFRKCVLLLSLLTTAMLHAYSQLSPVNQALNKFALKETVEHIYLQYDKPYYQPGETVWFKAWCLMGTMPTASTKTMYVDWSDDSGHIVAHDAYPVANASTHGQFDVPASYTGKTLHVQAYTKWMLNFDTAFLYRKTLPIFQEKDTVIPSAPDPRDTLFFFPEGGDMVTGLFNRIAFMAVDRYQQPVQVSGIITASSGETIDSFQSKHDGMGYFYLQPTPGDTYSAHWTAPDGKQHHTALPATRETGVVMNLHIGAGKHLLQLQRTDDTTLPYRQLHLVATQNQELVYEANISLNDETTAQVEVPVTTLPSGIIRYTIFDAGWKPLVERIGFINNGEYQFTSTLKADTLAHDKRGLNVFTVNIPDSLLVDLAVSVTDGTDTTKDNSDHIISYLLLSSELKGTIRCPSCYFKDNSSHTQENLDLLMLTHGWRRYNWEKILREEQPVLKYGMDSTYLSFSGQLSENRLQALQKVLKDSSRKHLIIFSLRPAYDTLMQLLTLPISSDGHFSMPNLLVFDNLQVSYQFSDKRINFSEFDIDFIPERLDKAIPAYKPALLNTAPKIAGRPGDMMYQPVVWQIDDKTIQLKTVDIKGKSRTELLEEKYTGKNSMFRNMFGYSVNVEDDPKANLAMNIFTYLMMKVPGLKIEAALTASDTPKITWTGYRSMAPGKGYMPPAIYYNEAISNAESLMSLPVTEVAYVKAFTPPFGLDEGGAIAIYTKGRKNYTNPRPSNLKQEMIIGYAAIREFYSPDHSNPASDPHPDARTTLYWNPMLRADSAGAPVKIRFYNNDYSKAYRIVVEGITRNGKLTRIEQRIEAGNVAQ